MIRTRFAPSPTGYLHIGGVRTALFSYLYAKNQKGVFLLRIEDTDRERSRKEFEDEILGSLKWLGLDWEGEIVYQSKRVDRYRELAADLIKRDLAYEAVEEGKKAVKLKMPHETVRFEDAVRGDVQFDTSLFDDLVIMKSDGFPTYHFACVVDDHDSEISHVIRGEDHLSNTPRQILLFKAFGWKPPKYAHLPLILGTDGTPLSKRHGAVAVSHYKEEGFLPEAVLNYLALLGWGVEGNQELYDLDTLIKKFSLKKITKSGAQFNPEKFEWVNAQHIKKLPDDEYVRRITEFFPDKAAEFSEGRWRQLTLLYKTRLKTWKDLTRQAVYFFEEPVMDSGPCTKFFSDKKLSSMLKCWIEKAKLLSDFEDDKKTEEMTRQAAAEANLEAKDIIHPLRFALTGMTVSPGLFEMMRVLGRDVCIKRVEDFIAKGEAHV